MARDASNATGMVISKLTAQIEEHSPSKKSKGLIKFNQKKVRKMKKQRNKLLSQLMMWEKCLCSEESYILCRVPRSKTRENTSFTHSVPYKVRYVV